MVGRRGRKRKTKILILIKNMKKIFFVLAVSLAIFLPFNKTEAITGDDAYKAVVKIYTYYEDSNFYLSAYSTGSGVLISGDGLILTNNHVVDLRDNFNDPLPVAFKVCLTTTTTDEPDCRFSADLVDSDEEKDIALLKIKNIGLTNLTSFEYLRRPATMNYKDGDVVLALGYPSSGGETITGTYGTISGNLEKYGTSWIKTSALVSFGSSGGALVDMEGNLLGITTAVNSDLGYAINIVTLSDWINSGSVKPAKKASLEKKMKEMIIKEDSLKNADSFSNNLPSIKIFNPKDWKIKYENENIVSFTNKNNIQGGGFTVSWNPTDTYMAPMLDVSAKGLALTGNYFLVGKTKISGIEGRKLIQTIGDGEEISLVMIPSKNYFIDVVYYYGQKNVDKAVIDEAISKIVISDANNKFKEVKNYEHKKPYFKLSLKNNWSLIAKNSVAEPLSGQRLSVPEIGFTVYVDKLSDNMKKMNNQNYFDYIKNEERIKSDFESHYGLEAERYFLSTKYKASNELNNIIFYKYKFKDKIDKKQIKAYAAGYRFIKGDYAFVVEFSYLGEDQKVFEKNLKDFERDVLKGMTLKAPASKK